MNLRNTVVLFALFLTMLWVFGFMLAVKQPLAEEGYLLPSMKREASLNVQSLSFERNLKSGKDSFSFVKEKDGWRLVVGSEATIIESARINPLIERIKNAKHNPDSSLSGDLPSLGLEPPVRSITVKGRPEDKAGVSGNEMSWTLNLGHESADKMVVYAQSSERPDRVFAITKRDIEPLLFDDPVSLHSQLFFNFPVEDGFIEKISIQSGDKALELSQTEGRNWRFDKPALGYADYEPAEVLKGLRSKTDAGVKGLIYAIRSLRVAEDTDFVPLGKAPLSFYGLEDGKESMRIDVVSRDDRIKKDVVRETLLVGKSVNDKWSEMYVRLAGDPAVAKLAVKHLAPIQRALANPVPLRSRDLNFFQPDRVGRVELMQDKQTFALSRGAGEAWRLSVGTGGERPAEEKAVENLLQTLLGKQAIETFEPIPQNTEKADITLGFDKAMLETTIHENLLEKGGKARVTRLIFGAKKGDTVAVKRILPDGQVSRFEVLATLIDKITGGNPELTYLERSLPPFDMDAVLTLSFQRGGTPIEIKRDLSIPNERWLLKDEREATGFVPADLKSVHTLLERLARLPVKRWVKRMTPKEDLASFGLDHPAATITLTIRNLYSPTNASGMVGMALSMPISPWFIPAGGMLQTQAGPPETIVLRLGKDNGKEGEERGTFATRSDLDLIFLLPPALLKEVQTEEFRDRRSMFALQTALDVGLFSQATAGDLHGLALVSPLATGRVQAFDPSQVKELKYALRTPAELRQFVFSHSDKEGWKDQSNLLEFQLEGEKVKQFLRQLSELHASQILSITGTRAEQRLGPKDATLRLDLTMNDGSTLTFAVGAAFEKMGYYGHTSAQPNFVFLLPASSVDPWFRGLALFAKERVALAP